MIKKILKMIGLILLLIVSAIVIWMYTAPQFGASPTAEQKQLYSTTDHFEDGKFLNKEATNMNFSWKAIKEMLWEFTHPVANIRPKGDIIPEKIAKESINKEPMKTKITWFGHSAFMVEMDGKVMLLDPMFGVAATPHPWVGSKRYNSTFPMPIDDLPNIDIVIYSHDHYDHLDYGSVKKLVDKVDHWIVPWGLDNHLIKWGVNPDKITALDWWQETVQHDIEFVFTPARHFSGRGITDRFETLWGSWVIKGATERVYFSGDSGYGDHFKEIGRKYGPFDIALMECGQYNHKWADIHMMPEQTVQAALDVKAKVMMPIHWGAFTLAVHSWIEPVQRARIEADRLGMTMTTPKIGEQIIINEKYPDSRWWLDYVEMP